MPAQFYWAGMFCYPVLILPFFSVDYKLMRGLTLVTLCTGRNFSVDSIGKNGNIMKNKGTSRLTLVGDSDSVEGPGEPVGTGTVGDGVGDGLNVAVTVFA